MVEATISSQKKENTAKEHLDPLPGQVLKARENLNVLLKETKGSDKESTLY